MRRRTRAIASTIAWSLAGLAVAISVVATFFAVLEGRTALHPFTMGGLTLGFSFAIVGGLVAARAPRNAIGWLFLVIALSQATTTATGSYTYAALAHGWDAPGITRASWLSLWTWAPGFVTFVALVPLLFPTGRPPSRRWRPVLWLSLLAMAAMVVVHAVLTWADPVAFASDPTFELETWARRLMDAPLVMTLVAGLASLAAMAQRYRRSAGAERQQLKWFLWAALIAVSSLLTLGFALDADAAGAFTALAAVPVVLVVPVAVGVSILRYRLYEIDRIVSRTVTYALLSVVLIGLYAGGVLGLGWLLQAVTGGTGGDLLVAATTLAVAAAFGPVRRRIRVGVDRRFNRSRYDASREVERFGARLRDEVDLAAASRELVGAAHATLQPSHAAVWFAPAERASRSGDRHPEAAVP